MELPGIIYPPNRPLERSMGTSQTPVLYDFLYFIETNRNGEIILGCSNLAGTYWEGTLFHYKSFELARENVYNSYFINNSTTSDAKFIQDDCILLAEDIGCLKLLNLPVGDGETLMVCKDSYEKENRIVQLAVWNTPKKFATCTEKCINLYEINDSSIQFHRNFINYHTDRITSIDANKSDENIFLSTSADRKACLWDIRMDMPATVIYNNEFSCLTTASWNPTIKEHVVIGAEAGDIYLLDIKQPKDVLSTTHCFDSSIHKTCFNDLNCVAVCGNSPIVLIYDCENEQFRKCYESYKHDTIVKGLTWYKSSLYSCGFDRKIVCHHC